jgi:hypothetical protein
VLPWPTDVADIQQSTKDVDHATVVTGTGDALPAQVDSKRLHQVPGGVTHDDQAKGSTRYDKHKAQTSLEDRGLSEGSAVERNVPGLEDLTPEEAAEKVGSKE